MYNTYTGGCNILNLQISRHKQIEVKSNNIKSWDHTNPLLPVIEPRSNNLNNNNNNNNNINSNNMNNNQSNEMNMNLAGSINPMSGGKNSMNVDHPLLPMPMNMAAAAAAAAAAAGHHFNANNSPFLHSHPSQQQQQQQQQHHHPHQQGGPQHGLGSSQGGPYSQAAAAAQSVTGYPIQTLDSRPAVVQVSNFADQVNKYLPWTIFFN